MNSNIRSLVGHDMLRQTGEGVFYTDQNLVVLDKVIVGFLKESALAASRKRARLCAHPTPDSDQHDMLIVSHRQTYVAPHRHLVKSETFLILEGFANAILFDEGGTIRECIPMGPADSGRPFFYRMPAEQFHSLAIESEFLVFLESSKGPFTPGATEYAPWAPEPNDPESGREYLRRLLRVHD
jgi:cupin fold WbuC family metalloprotein